MKHTLLVLLLITAFIAKGQNAYYDSKYIIDWLNYKSPDKAEEAKRQLKVYNKLKAYIDPQNKNDSNHYFMVDAVYQEFFKRNESDITLDGYKDLFLRRSIATFKKDYPRDSATFTRIGRIIKIREHHITALEAYKKALYKLDEIIYNQDETVINEMYLGATHVKINDIELPLNDKGEADAENIRFWGRTTFSREQLKYADTNVVMRTEIMTNLKDSLSKSIAYMEGRKQEFDASAKTLFLKLSQEAKMSVIGLIFSGKTQHREHLVKLIQESVKEGQRQSEIRIVAQQNQPTVQLSNFKMPSQGEIIDALAIYVAKRFKQEAIMYMIEQLKENMVEDMLFTIMFPETRKLLFSQNAFSVPRFGTEWKYAISKDYALMPDHILTSKVMKDKFDTESFNSMRDAWLLAKMVEKKYSYVEIIRNYATNDSDKIKTPLMKTFTKWSYLLNEELFSTYAPETFGSEVSDSIKMFAASTTSGDYWVAPANFNKEVSPEQLSLMLAMLQQRYRSNMESELGIDLSGPIKEQAPRLTVIKKWMSRNLLVLNQFQKNQDKLFNTELKDEERAFFNGVSYWTFMNDIVSSFIDSAVMPGISATGMEQLKYVSDVNEIYGSFQAKNYPAAVSQVMGIIEHLCKENTEYMLSQDLRVTYKSRDLYALKNKYKMAEAMNIYSTYFSESINSDDLQEFNGILNRKIEGLRLAVNDHPDPENIKAFASIEKKVQKFDWNNIKESETLRKELVQFKNNKLNQELDYLIDSMVYVVDSSFGIIAGRYDSRLSGFSNSYCRSLNKAKSYASLLTDIMNSGTNSQNLSKVIEAHAAPVTSYKLKRYNRTTLDIGAYLGAYIGMESVPQNAAPVKAVYGLTVPIGFNYTWATLKPINAKRVKYPYARKNDKVREFSGVSHSIGLSIIDIAAPVAYRLTNSSDGALPKNVKWSQMLSPGLHYRYGFKNAPVCLSTGVQYTPQLRNFGAGNQLSAVRVYIGVLFDMPLFFISK